MALPDPVRRRLGSFSRTMFSDNNRTSPERRGSGESLDNEIVSSLPLQMSLYFNLYFFPFWWLSSVVMLQLKYPVLPDYYKFILVTVIVLVSLIEAIRLYLGYMGNLQEKRPRITETILFSFMQFSGNLLSYDSEHLMKDRNFPQKGDGFWQTSLFCQISVAYTVERQNGFLQGP
ncbi:transmembrane protein 17 isoform X3 [Carettochelys insculpta]|uniref:transmembrane protein 17 isoform X3 n=1 Tax=Carettochelys insculpta TaxID=44489 RepID=UPI003EBE02EB